MPRPRRSPASPAKPDEIVAYHDSGDWDVDIDRVVRRARRQIIRHRNDDDPALMLDIDDTSLSTSSPQGGRLRPQGR